MDCIALRFSNVYGPRQNPNGEAGVVAIFCDRFLRGERPVIYGDGKQTRDYLYISDAVDAVMVAAESQKEYHWQFNIGTEAEIDVITIAELLSLAAGQPHTPIYLDARRGEQRRSAIAIDRAALVLRWTPRVKIEKGLELTWDWFLQNNRLKDI
jgi:UDP-glucose 4-epimerase